MTNGKTKIKAKTKKDKKTKRNTDAKTDLCTHVFELPCSIFELVNQPKNCFFSSIHKLLQLFFQIIVVGLKLLQVRILHVVHVLQSAQLTRPLKFRRMECVPQGSNLAVLFDALPERQR
jgi:hypothetical protein